MKTKFAVSLLAAFVAASCAATQPSSTATEKAPTTLELQAPATYAEAEQGELTIKQIMADQDWVARSPSSAYWMADSSGVLYQQKREGSVVSDWYHLPLDGDEAHKVPLDKLHNYAYNDGVYNAERTLLAYTFEGNVFVRDLLENTTRQLTRDETRQSQLMFLNDGRLAFREGHDFFAVNVESGLTEQLVALATRSKPEAVSEPKDFIAQEQVDLIKFVQKERAARQARADQDEELTAANDSLAPQPFYLGDNKQIVAASLSPAGDKMVVAVTTPQSWRDDGDIMPNYVAEDGRVKAESVRRRVADAKPVEHQIILLDLVNGNQTQLTYNTLPGWNEDVLAEVKAENYAAIGKEYEPKQSPRPIILMRARGWSEYGIRWSENGNNAVVMLEAWDNKDRWLASIDFAGKQLVNEHRLHDDAWVNNTHNDFDFIPGSNDTVWFQSEQDGYAHLYTKVLGGEQKQLTAGKFVTENPVADPVTKSIYFTANEEHPGIYELYRLSFNGGDIETLTDLDGMVESFSLSPDRERILFNYSSALQPSELYSVELGKTDSVARLTETVTEQFQSYSWTVPEIVPVPSSHVDDPIYTRVYYPEGYDAERAEQYPAVVFIHGAGYLQNAHAGWSGYQREFMFHTFLNEQGYVVFDLDYRGSKGYGRDWRTAVYRQMGTPEVEDLVDVVKWAGENTNVDTNRMGTYGGSYGGFLTFMALFKKPGLFKAGAALRPVSDWAHYNTGYTSNILNLPSDDPIAYRRSSPIYFTEGLEDALLINSPMVDDNVFFQDSVRLVQRLIEHEKEDFETAIFPVEPHGFRQPSSWLDEYRRIYKLFEENVK